MADSDSQSAGNTGVLLAKLRSTPNLLAASDRAGVTPLHVSPDGSTPLGLAGDDAWFAIEMDPQANPWDQAHDRVADQLGIDRSDVLFVEPDLIHSIYRDGDDSAPDDGLAIGANCADPGQDGTHGKKTGTGWAWHMGSNHSQLKKAGFAFTDSARLPRTRIAHIDTGYSAVHETLPAHLNMELQRNFVAGDGRPRNAGDPDNDKFLMDNSGHGTGTLSILAGGPATGQVGAIGGAPEADVVPIRIADRVVLLRTSSLATALRYAADVDCSVASLSMGGLPSKAWAESVDYAYDLGLCLVAAAGNTIGELPPRAVVYPARYDRVIAVAGVMADGSPYENLSGKTLEGVSGPGSAMHSAMAAYTPNIPWAAFGCPTTTRMNGEGTSAATPQVAAAAALWIEKYKDSLPADWRRVEAVRHALFSKAKTRSRSDKFGNGILQAHKSLQVLPNVRLEKSKKSKHRWAFLRMLTGLAIEGSTPAEDMFNLELEQLWLRSPELYALLPDPEDFVATTAGDRKQVDEILEAVIENELTSDALRRHLKVRANDTTTPTLKVKQKAIRTASRPAPPAGGPPPPAKRSLRVYAKDPTLSSSFATTSIGQVTLQVPWEQVTPTAHGFYGEYIEVVDDEMELPSGDKVGPGLDHPNLLAQNGWAPSPGNGQFHQQMVYAVAMKTIEHFERALGRPVQWRPEGVNSEVRDDKGFVRRLALRPHALQSANAYYSPKQSALLFGSFAPRNSGAPRRHSTVYTCLSYDIVAHETTHAVIDGMYRRFSDATNPDMLAFHEAFSDLVALLQGFDLTELLEHEIRQSRGNLQADTLLGKLALQFGSASRGSEALRSAIGTTDENGDWVRSRPDLTALDRLTAPHERSTVLVSAVFDAFIAIYEARTADLFRIATGGTGKLPDGAIHPDLARRLASEASKSARHLLRMCMRALDFLPPVDVTFFDFLRAVITADHDFVPDDTYNYRVAIVEAFLNRGIGPGPSDDLSSLSSESLRWPGFSKSDASGSTQYYKKIVTALRRYAEECVPLSDRNELFDVTRKNRAILNGVFRKAFESSSQFRRSLGLVEGSFEVHSLRRAMRARPNGRVEPEIILSLLQSRTVSEAKSKNRARHQQVGGVTLIVNLARDTELPRYRIVKSMTDQGRHAATAAFALANAADPLRELYLGSGAEQFGALHHLAEEH